MQLVQDRTTWTASEDELAPEETHNFPFFGFVTGAAVSLVLWAVIAWTVWAMVG
jgi:hypothetical protein